MITVNQLDPTRTKTLRDRYSSEMRRRYNELEKDTGNFIEENQAGIITALFFWQVLEGFLTRQIDTRIYGNNEAEWMTPFVTGGYLAGIRHADRQLGQINRILPEVSAINFRDEIAVIRAQNFTLLKGINEEMARQIQQELILGVQQGLNPREVAENISGRIQKIGRTRAEILARTETIRAHAEATLGRYEMAGVSAVTGLVEFLSAADNRVCERCSALHGQIFTIQEARGVIPVHCRCRCAWGIAQPEINRIIS